MAKKTDKARRLSFRRRLWGYKKKDVEEYIGRLEEERAGFEKNNQERIGLLVAENEHAAQIISALQADKDMMLSDQEIYRKQLKEQGETITTLYERLDLLGAETERLQNELNDIKQTGDQNDTTVQAWKQRALTAEETVRRLAQAEIKADREYDNAKHFRFPIGKKAYLDLTLHKDDIDI